MNKLAILAISLLLILGGLMWFTANGSFNQYLSNYVALINKQLKDTGNLSINSATIAAHQGRGQLTEISLTTNNKQALQSSVKINQLTWVFDKKSLKKDTVIVEQVMIPELVVTHTELNSHTAFNNIQQAISRIIEQAIKQNSGLNGKSEFSISINQLTIEHIYITKYQEGIPIEEVISSNRVIKSDLLASSHKMSIAAALLTQELLTLITVIDKNAK